MVYEYLVGVTEKELFSKLYTNCGDWVTQQIVQRIFHDNWEIRFAHDKTKTFLEIQVPETDKWDAGQWFTVAYKER